MSLSPPTQGLQTDRAGAEPPPHCPSATKAQDMVTWSLLSLAFMGSMQYPPQDMGHRSADAWLPQKEELPLASLKPGVTVASLQLTGSWQLLQVSGHRARRKRAVLFGKEYAVCLKAYEAGLQTAAGLRKKKLTSHLLIYLECMSGGKRVYTHAPECPMDIRRPLSGAVLYPSTV